jgi:hypothetical protein
MSILINESYANTSLPLWSSSRINSNTILKGVTNVLTNTGYVFTVSGLTPGKTYTFVLLRITMVH